MRKAVSALLLLLALAACGAGDTGRNDQNVASLALETGAQDLSALERAALETGAIADAGRISPVGLYRNRHEAGADQLCIAPGESEERMRFALEARFGGESGCRGHGTVRRAGERLIFNFARSACLVVAGYEGDRIAFPGAVDVDCASLCSERGALDGVSFPRFTREPAPSAKDSEGQPLCPE